MNTFKKNERLCSIKDVELLYAKGKQKTIFPFKIIFKENTVEIPFPVRFLAVVPKRLHKRANKRNTIRRRIKEIYRLHKEDIYKKLKENNKQYDIMLIYLSSEELSYADLEPKVLKALQVIE